jgi:hypothetical protein
MVRCEICNKEFPFAWKLRRHLARQKSCYKNPTATNDSSLATNDSSLATNDSKIEHRCKYCNKIFTRAYTRKHHEEKRCKYNNEIWLLEKECKVEHKQQECKLQCKYCKRMYSKTGNLSRHLETCKTKEGYIMALTEKKEVTKVSTVTNNITNNNNNIQNANTIIN